MKFKVCVEYKNTAMNYICYKQCNSVNIAGKLDAPQTQSKFKNLRDTHRRIVQTEQKAGGCAKVDAPKWKHYEIMEFLRDSVPERL